MTFVLGMNCKLYYKVGGQDAVGSWIEMGNVRDVTLSMEAGVADLTTRANNGWRAQVPTLREAGVEFQMVWDTADAGFTALREAFLSNGIIGLQVLDGEGGQGLQGDFGVQTFSRNEALEEGVTVDVSVAPSYSETEPTWIGA